MIAVEVTVLPDPDSPTIAVVKPGKTPKLTSFTTTLSKAILRLLTLSTGFKIKEFL
tara:strand:- start:247 stop:414 length:168 start_codon:yes stop_codon:yes gene_type:complete